MRLLSKKDRGSLLEFSIGFWIPGSSRVYQLVVRRRGPVERKERRGEERRLSRSISRRIEGSATSMRSASVKMGRWWLAGGLKYSSQCSPGRGTDTPWQLEARERHARWTHIFYPTEKPSSPVPPSVDGGASSASSPTELPPPQLALVSGRIGHRLAVELVASVPFSEPDPIQNLCTIALPLLIPRPRHEKHHAHLRTPSRIYVTLRYVTCSHGEGRVGRGDGQRQGLIKPTLHRHS